MAAIVIFWPALVTMWLDKQQTIDLDKVRIELPAEETPRSGPADVPQAPGAPAGSEDAASKPDSEQESADAIQRELLRGTSPGPGK